LVRANTQQTRAIFLIEQYFVINMVLSCFTPRSADDCCSLATVKKTGSH
jgi:hypothetical protein